MARTSSLSQIGFADIPVRGIDSGPTATPISAAVVIGIGGSGIQTITRTRAAIRSQRPDQAAMSAVRFIGIDAVDTTAQQPPLPPGVGLDIGEFFNLVAQPLDASAYVRSRLNADGFLAEWWDADYRPPVGPLTEGLKRERMLGRLAFYRSSQALVTKIQSAMSAAIAIDAEQVAEGGRPKTDVIPVYIVNSCAGGTGSAGFLEVVLAAWEAARVGGYHPEIRALTFLPGVFRTVTTRQPQGLAAVEAQQANVYAFFREVDHFSVFSSQLGRFFGRPEPAGGPVIPDGELLKQVYLIDTILRAQGEFSKLDDLYEIAAEALYHFLLTDSGRPLVGVDATNTDRALAEYDRFKKPRRYCSLGIARVVFPGDTYRYHLLMRYVDWVITDSFLAEPPDPDGLVRDHPVVLSLEDKLLQVEAEAGSVNSDEDVIDFLQLAEQAALTLERIPEPSEAHLLISKVETDAAGAVRSIQESVTSKNRLLLAELEDSIERTLFDSGHGVPFAERALKVVSKRLRTMRTDAEAEFTKTSSAKVGADERVRELQTRLQAAANRGLVQRLVARVGSMAGKAEMQADIARHLGQAIQSWTQAIFDSEVAAARDALVVLLSARIDELRLELERSTERLRQLSREARHAWEQDDLLGKDAGPEATTTLIPKDVQPEVEQSSVAKQCFEDLSEEHGSTLHGDALNQFIARWSSEHEHRGFFSLGARQESEQYGAEQSLIAALKRDGEARALETGPTNQRRSRLPASLREASAQDPQRLVNGIAALARQSRGVCWAWDEGRFQLDAADGERPSDVLPAVTTVIAHPSDLHDDLRDQVGEEVKLVAMNDPERVVALSCEWAVPVHAVVGAPAWREHYERAQRRKAKDARLPPNHIDRRFGTDLHDLMPDYVDASEVSRLLGQALVIGSMITSADERIMSRYDHGRREPALPHVQVGDAGRFVGHVLRLVDGRIQADRNPIDLGSSWEDLVDQVGNNSSLRASIEQVAGWLSRAVGSDALIAVVATYISDRLDPLVEVKATEPREVDILEGVLDGLSAWQTDLRSMGALGQ